MDKLIIASQFILSISLLVTLHEMGHFFPARWFGMRVDKFYLFFDPWFSLFKVKKGDTEYGIGWLPLGGYVKIAGMVDESMDTEQLAQEPQPWEFRSKPAWQRLIVMLGGVTVNFILGFFILSMILWLSGRDYIPTSAVKDGIYLANPELGAYMGLKEGDKLLGLGQNNFDKFGRAVLFSAILTGSSSDKLRVEREGQTLELPLPPGIADSVANYKKDEFMGMRLRFVVDKFAPKSPAEAAGLQAGDSLVGINGREDVQFFHEFILALDKLKGEKITLDFYRAGEPKSLEVQVSEEGKLGIFPRTPAMAQERFGFFSAIAEGTKEGVNFVIGNIIGIGKMFTGEVSASKNLGGFISIASLFGTTWDWLHFWRMTAILSLILGFMNLLPIPALDGGHVVFLTFEMITGRPVNQKVLEMAQMVGFLLLIGLLLYANGLDIYRNLF